MKSKLQLNLKWKNNTIEGVTDKDLESDIKLIKETFCQTVTEKAVKRIFKFAQQEMREYYKEFNPPEVYVRTGDMQNNSFKEYRQTKGNIYQGGIEIDSSFTKHYGGFLKEGELTEPGLTEEEIYTSVWDLGLHGRTKTYIHSGDHYVTDETFKYKQGKPHRFNRISQKASTQEFLNTLEHAGLSAVTKQKYSVLKFS